MQAGEMPAHFEREHRDGERQRDPEAPGHVGKLGARASGFPGDFRLERHTADRAAPRMVLTNFWMHRAGVDRALGRRLRGRPPGRGGRNMTVRAVIVAFMRCMGATRMRRGLSEKPLRLRKELFPAAGGAEIVSRARVLGLVPGGRRVDRHSADRILDERSLALAGFIARGPLCSMRAGRRPSCHGKVKRISGHEHRRGGRGERSDRQDDPPLRGDRPPAAARAPLERVSRLRRAGSS